MSGLSQDARHRIQRWAQMQKHHSAFQQTDINSALLLQNPQENPKDTFYVIQLKHVANLKMPPRAARDS